jgi:hypothetical protein
MNSNFEIIPEAATLGVFTDYEEKQWFRYRILSLSYLKWKAETALT